MKNLKKIKKDIYLRQECIKCLLSLKNKIFHCIQGFNNINARKSPTMSSLIKSKPQISSKCKWEGKDRRLGENNFKWVNWI